MHMMTEHGMGGPQYYMIALWFAIGALALVIVALAFFFTRRAPVDGFGIDDLANTGSRRLRDFGKRAADRATPVEVPMHDTLFILPDISNYTKFMAGNRFAFAHARHIIFHLINAMIEAATKTFELSKLEGDAALFFVDAGRHTPQVNGQAVMDIFRAFFQERQRLMDANICPCGACHHIESLDLKIFVHRGQTARFKFRGAVDHFGSDVIILHRMMKTSVEGHRYVMVTEAAADSIDLGAIGPEAGVSPFEFEEEIEHVGKVRATVFTLSDALAADLATDTGVDTPAKLGDLWRKLRENLASLRHLFGRRHRGAATDRRPN